MIPRPDVLIGNLTHVGMERSVNQDYYGYLEPETQEEFEALGRLIIVCDGMGGHAGGEVAARLAVETIIDVYRRSRSGNPLEDLRVAIEAANRAVWNEAQAKPDLKGMGTTAVAMVLRQGMAYFAHVGDSRAYLIRENQLHQITLDHSLVQQMVNEGLLPEEEMENHPEKNVILRSLGVKPDVEVELNYQPFQPEDIFILSSDGLTGLVSKEECFQIATMYRDNPMQACMHLVELANKYGGYDNITVQIARVLAMSPDEAAKHGYGSVQQQIADARSEAVKFAPSQSEMQSNEAPAGESKNITGVVSADEVAKIKEQLQQQQLQQQQAAASSGGKKAGVGVAVLVAVGVLLVILGIVIGLIFSRGNAESAANLQFVRGQAISMADTEAYEQADAKARDALRKAGGLLGWLTAGGALREAAAAFEALVDDRPAAAGLVTEAELRDARRRAEAARTRAGDAFKEVQTDTPVTWTEAEEHMAKGAAAEEEQARARALEHFLLAAMLFKTSEEKALRSMVDDYASKLQDLRRAADEARAPLHLAELLDAAETEQSRASGVRERDVALALQHLRTAAHLTEAAVKLAPVIEKKN